MRHFMVDPDNEERLLKVPPHVVQAIKREALDAAREAIEALRGCLGTDDNGDGTVWVEKADVLDAIDALREKP